jgi:hypothetical protein
MGTGKQTFNILKVREYVADKESGEIGKEYIRVGSAWQLDGGGMSLEIAEGISVTGRVVILPRKERNDQEE